MIQFMFTAAQAALIMFSGAALGAGAAILFFVWKLEERIRYEHQLRSTREAAEQAFVEEMKKSYEIPRITIDPVDSDPDASTRALARMDEDQKARMATRIMEVKAEKERTAPVAVVGELIRSPRERFKTPTPWPDPVLPPWHEPALLAPVSPSPTSTPTPITPSRPGAHRKPSRSPVAELRVSLRSTGGEWVAQTVDPVTQTDLINLKSIREYTPGG